MLLKRFRDLLELLNLLGVRLQSLFDHVSIEHKFFHLFMQVFVDKLVVWRRGHPQRLPMLSDAGRTGRTPEPAVYSQCCIRCCRAKDSHTFVRYLECFQRILFLIVGDRILRRFNHGNHHGAVNAFKLRWRPSLSGSSCWLKLVITFLMLSSNSSALAASSNTQK